MEFYFFQAMEIHGKVMEIKRHPLAKRHFSFLLSSISIEGYVYVIRSNFGVFHSFLYCDWNLVHNSQIKTGGGYLYLLECSWYMSLSCHETLNGSLILKLWSWRSRGNNIEI